MKLTNAVNTFWQRLTCFVLGHSVTDTSHPFLAWYPHESKTVLQYNNCDRCAELACFKKDPMPVFAAQEAAKLESGVVGYGNQ